MSLLFALATVFVAVVVYRVPLAVTALYVRLVPGAQVDTMSCISPNSSATSSVQFMLPRTCNKASAGRRTVSVHG